MAAQLVVAMLATLPPASAQGNPFAVLPAARRAAREGDLECAEKLYTDVLSRDPDDRDALKGRAQVLAWNTRYAEAEVDYRRVLGLHPLDVEAETGLALALLRENRFSESESRVRDLLDWRPEDHDARLLLGEILLRTDRPVEAESEFQRASAIEPADPRGRGGRARALAACGRTAEARAVDEATADWLGKHLAQHPEDDGTRLALATVLCRLDRIEDASAEYERVLRRKPSHREAEIGRASTDLRLGRVDAARTHIRSLLQGHPGSTEAHGLQGDLLLRLGRAAEAERAFAFASELDPWNAQYRIGLANSRAARWDVDGARSAAAEAFDIDPWSRDVRDALGRVEDIQEPWRFRLDTSVRLDRLTGPEEDWWQETAHLAWRPRADLALGLGYDHYSRFDLDDDQMTVDGSWRISDPWTVSAAFTYGPDAELVARSAVDTEVSRKVGDASTAFLRWRHATYVGDVRTDLVSPGLEIPCGKDNFLLARYHYVNNSETGDGNAGSLRLELFRESGPRTQFGIAYGTEAFLADTVGQAIRTSNVLTLFGGVEWRCSKATKVSLAYDYEDHETSSDKQGLTLGFTVEF